MNKIITLVIDIVRIVINSDTYDLSGIILSWKNVTSEVLQ